MLERRVDCPRLRRRLGACLFAATFDDCASVRLPAVFSPFLSVPVRLRNAKKQPAPGEIENLRNEPLQAKTVIFPFLRGVNVEARLQSAEHFLSTSDGLCLDHITWFVLQSIVIVKKGQKAFSHAEGNTSLVSFWRLIIESVEPGNESSLQLEWCWQRRPCSVPPAPPRATHVVGPGTIQGPGSIGNTHQTLTRGASRH
jgi:hypothetical protein